MNLFWQFFCVLAFGTACWAVGDFLRKGFFHENLALPTVARHTLAFTVGNITFSYLLTALGFAGLFIPAVLWGVFLAAVGLAVWWIAAGLGQVPRPILVEREGQGGKGECGSENARTTFFLAASVGLFLVAAILQAAAPPYVRDSLVYHLLCPKEYLKAGHILHIGGNLFSAFPKGHEVLMTLLLAVAGDRAAQGFSILQQGATIGGLYSLARLTAGPWPAALCALAFATVPPAIYFAGCGYVEPALLMALGSSLLTLAFSLKSSGEKPTAAGFPLKEAAFVGLIAGWMTALKYTGLFYLSLVGLILLWTQRRAPLNKILGVWGAFILAVAPGLCWLVWNWVTLGNPVYPMHWSFFGGRDWDAVRERAISLYFLIFGMGRDGWDYLLLPWRLSFSGRFDSLLFDGAVGPFLLIFLPLVAASAWPAVRRRVNQGGPPGLGFMFLASTAFFVFGTQQARFWLPSQFLACLYAAPAVSLLVRWAKGQRLVKLALGMAVVASLSWNGWFLGKQVAVIGYHRPVLGLEAESAFLSRIVPGYPAMEFINRNLPESSRLFCVWTGAYGYYLDRKYYSDTFLEDATFKRFIDASTDGKELSQKLAEAGYTHLFVRLPLLGKNLEPRQVGIFGDFLKKEARELFRHRDFSVFLISRD